MDTVTRTVGGPAARADWRAPGAAEHVVQFYDRDPFLLDAVGAFLGAGLRAGEAAIVIATGPHRAGVAARLTAAGVDVAAAGAGQYVALDAAETLAHCLVDGAPDPECLAAVIGDHLTAAATGGRPVRVFGEMVALLAEAGNHRAAMGLEALCNRLQQAQPFVLYCAYPLAHIGGPGTTQWLGDVCAAHSQVIPAESYTTLPTDDDRLRAIVLLQQQAQALHGEIAARQAAEERLRDALAAERAARAVAEAAVRARDEFLSIAAHELKTPLTSLRGYAQLAQRRLRQAGPLERARVLPALEAITEQAGTLSQLVGRLLDLSRLEAGTFALERQWVDLAALVARVVAGIRTWDTGHTITLQCPATLAALVDPVRLEQVLTTLLDNAQQYSPEGGSIAVVLAAVAEGTIELAVRDRGLGIPPERRDHLFERYYRAHDAGHRSGMGLGLSLCRQIVALHGGEIQAEFPADGGMRVVVRLPLEAPSVAAPSGDGAGPARRAATRHAPGASSAP
jgi:signal transduction histidine kinase